MSKAVLLSIQPRWCEKIASGRKTIEVRKTRPSVPTPFKCYIYCTNGSPYLNRHNGNLYLEAKDTLGGKWPGLYERLSGRVIGEFVCDYIFDIIPACSADGSNNSIIGLSDVGLAHSCMSMEDLLTYGNRKMLYGWHISELKIYDKPKELSEFEGLQKTRFGYAPYKITRPPQSWCYVEELT